MSRLTIVNTTPTAGVSCPAAVAASGPNPELAVQHADIVDIANGSTISELVDKFFEFDPEPLVDHAKRHGFTPYNLTYSTDPTYSSFSKILPKNIDKKEYLYLSHHLPSAIIDRDILNSTYYETSKMVDSLENAKRALILIARLPNYLRLVLVHRLWFDNESYGGFPPPIVFASMLKFLHSDSETGSRVLGNFGLYRTEGMFDIAAEGIEGFYLDGDTSRPLFDNWKCRRVYRGGHRDPEDLAKGMSWSLSIEEARRFAQRSIWGDGPGVVLATDAPKDDVLGVFDYEQEVVLRPHTRQYEIVEYVTP